MLTRILAAIVMSAFGVGLLLFAPWQAFAAVMAIVVLLAVPEILKMTRLQAESDGVTLWDRIYLSLALLLVVLQPVIDRLWPEFYSFSMAMAAGFMFLAITRLFRPKDLGAMSRALMGDAFALVYLGALFTPLLALRIGEEQGWYVLLAMVITFGGDTGAYFMGKSIGRHKLAERISPKKTIEGYFGALLLSTVAVVLLCLFAAPYNALSVADAIVLGLVGATLGMLGDLTESLLKRAVGIKDSGNLIPGHGGILDRFDGLLFVSPFIWAYLKVRGLC